MGRPARVRLAEWIDAPARVGDALAAGVLGARPGEVVVGDSTTVNQFKLCSAALDVSPGAIVTDRDNFPTDRYVLEGFPPQRGRELRLFARRWPGRSRPTSSRTSTAPPSCCSPT